MNSRRDFLKLIAACSACAAGTVQATGQKSAATTFLHSTAPYKVLGDQRHAASVAFVEAARAEGLPTQLLPGGDISRFWLNELQGVWQQAPRALAGLTDAAPLFCLEQLSAQYGLRVVQRETVVTQQGATLVAWLLAPRFS